MPDRIFKSWNPLDISNTKKFFFDLSVKKDYKTLFLLEKYNDGNFRVKAGFFYSDEGFPEDFVLDKTSPILKKLIEDYKGKDDAFVFDKIIGNLDTMLKEKGVVGGMAYPVFVAEELSEILMVCTKDETARAIQYESIYISKDQVVFSEICKKISSVLVIERTLRSENIGNFGLIIDILEKAIKENYDKDKIVDYYERLMKLFINHLQSSYKQEKDLKISSLFLLSYFLSCFFKDIIDKDRKEFCLKNYCCDEQIELYRHFANAIKFYLCNTDSQDLLHFKYKEVEKSEIDHGIFFNAVCYLISEYAYLKAKVDRPLDIESHLRRFLSSQTVLYSLQSSYRDHIFHMIDICLFGLFLLRNGFSQILSKISGSKEEDIFKNWFVASLLHDVGYVLNIYNLIDEEVKYITSKDIDTLKDTIKDATTEGIGTFTGNMLERLKGIGIEIKTGDLNGLDHGVVSALHVHNILEESSIDTKEYLPAISAVLMHNLTMKPLDLEKEPIAVLLAICDELQDWERPRVGAFPFKERFVAAIKYGGRLSFERSSMLDVIKISLNEEINPYADEFQLLTDNRLNFLLDYQDVSKQKDFYIFYPWLLKSFKLQRLNLKEGFDIHITFQNEPKIKGGDLDQLKRNRRKERIWYFEKWLDMIRDKYNISDDDKTEIIKISVKDLYERKPIQVNPEGYLAKLIIEK